ncbi:MAG TPA: EpsD family peptidyl-prolyl cis-trans isomerase [Methylophilus sp.]
MKKTVLFVPMLMLVLAGCGKHEDAGKAGSQVVAKVNGTEITVHQLNFALSKMGKLDEAHYKQASQTLLKQLVDMELFKQKAIEAKLDRNANVMQAMEATKNQILAQAYIQKIASKQAAPADFEINNFYHSNPELFSDRQIYVIQEFLVQNGNEKSDEIQSGISAAKNAEEIAMWLKGHDFQFAANTTRKAAEQLPLPLAKQLAGMKLGDTLVINNPNGLALLFIAKIDKEPVDIEKAKLAIKQFLSNSGQQTLVKNEIVNLHKTAKVEFYGDFKDIKIDNADVAGSIVTDKAAEQVAPVVGGAE